MAAVGNAGSCLPMQRSVTIAYHGDTPQMGCEIFGKRRRKDLLKPDTFWRHILMNRPRNHEPKLRPKWISSHKHLGEPLLGQSGLQFPSTCINRIVYPNFLIQKVLMTVFLFLMLMHFSWYLPFRQ